MAGGRGGAKGPERGRSSRVLFALLAAGASSGFLALPFGGCSSSGPSSAGQDGEGGPPPSSDAAGSADSVGADSAWQTDSANPEGEGGTGGADGGADVEASAPSVIGLAIVSANGAPLQGAPGDAIQLAVQLTMSDGSTRTASADEVTWLAPLTLVAEDPDDAGPDILPEAGAQPTAFFVENDYRMSNPGVLYVTDPGSTTNPTITVKATVGDAGAVSAAFSVLPALVGDAASGANLFLHGPECGTCHGPTGGGTPPALFPDGGPELMDGGPAFAISGQLYPYPAPGLNNAPDSGHLASDPAWNAALLGMAAQCDMDNRGVALRVPMPDWFGGTNATGGTLSGQDFADIYAWLKTQTK